MSYRMFVNINRGACLLRLQRNTSILKSRIRICGLALSNRLVLYIGLTSLRYICNSEKVLPTKAVSFSLIFVSFAGTMGKHVLGLWKRYNVPRPPYLPPLFRLRLRDALKREFLKSVTLTEAKRQRCQLNSSENCLECLLKQCEGEKGAGLFEPVTLCLWDLVSALRFESKVCTEA